MEGAARSASIKPSYLEVAVRAWATRTRQLDEDGSPQTRRRSPPSRRYPAYWLIVDTETTADTTQRLLIGCWRLCRTDESDPLRPRLDCLQEGLFYPDDLASWYPDGAAEIDQLKRKRPTAIEVVEDQIADPLFAVAGLKEFLDRTLWRAAWKLRAGVVCFNSPFDLSRIAWHAGEARTGKGIAARGRYDPYAGGFSFAVWERNQRIGGKRESRHRPRIAIKSIDSKRALKGFRAPFETDPIDQIPGGGQTEPDPECRWRGDFLDLRTLTFALTDRGHTLESACGAFDVPYTKRDVEHGRITRDYIEYCREDVQATQRLCEATLSEFMRHPVQLQASKAFSPATIGRSYLKAMGVRLPRKRQRWDPRFLGWAISAYYGGRAECRIRRTPVPVVYCDFLSMYPTVCTLMGIWRHLTAQRTSVVDHTERFRELLEDLSVEACLDPKLWPQLVGIARVTPDGDVLPVRARYGAGPSYQIGVNPLHSEEFFWYTFADVAASKILTGRTPQIERAYLLEPSEEHSALIPIELLGEVPIEPARDDFFKAIVERRKAAQAAGEKRLADSLKVLANATSYGIYAQMTRHELGGDRTEPVTVFGRGADPTEFRVRNPEDPGEYCFPPIAAAITGAARLMLATLELLVTDAGGTYAFCDTDSMAIVSTETGGLIPCPDGPLRTTNGEEAVQALSWDEVDHIRERLTAVNPYTTPETAGPLLELEDENFTDATRSIRQQLWCHAISAKRYALYTRPSEQKISLAGISGEDEDEDYDDPEPALSKPSQHGLGHLLNPTDSESEDRDWIDAIWTHILTGADPPDWSRRAAIARTSVSTPTTLRLFEALNASKEYPEHVKPFNFLNAAFVEPTERPADDERIVLVAPYERDPTEWEQQDWINRFNGRTYRITTQPSDGVVRPGLVTVKTYRDTILDYATHPEPKSLAADGAPCDRTTIGLLARRPVTPTIVQHIGKESNRLEEAQTGLLENSDEILNRYGDTNLQVFRELVVPVLQHLGVRETARRTGLGLGSVSAALSGRSTPRPRAISRYVETAVDHAIEIMAVANIDAAESDLGKLRQAVAVASAGQHKA
jgi:hypothetical protein